MKTKNSNQDNTWHVNTIGFPLNFMFKSGHDTSTHYLLGRPFLCYNLNGTFSYYYSVNLKIGSGRYDDLEALDYGLTINSGWEFKGGRIVRLGTRKE